MSNRKKPTFKISDIKFDDRNANKHSELGMRQLESSINQNGVIEAVTISADNVAISGNARTEKFSSKGMQDCILIESDGTKPVIIKRTDIQSKTKEFYNAALAANIVAESNINMDALVVDAICEDYQIEDWSNTKEKSDGRITKENLDPFEMTHVLISFPPEKLILIQALLEQVKNVDGIEYEQSSN